MKRWMGEQMSEWMSEQVNGLFIRIWSSEGQEMNSNSTIAETEM